MSDEDRIQTLEQRLADLKARLPKHSVSAAMMIEMEELEEELATLHKEPASAT